MTGDFRDLRVAIIGAGKAAPFALRCVYIIPDECIPTGMGGLGVALAFAKKGFRQIDVFETASNLGFVGAGIQMPPNVARVLDRFGVWEEIEAEATNVKDTSIRRT
jgi:hypothetical protein